MWLETSRPPALLRRQVLGLVGVVLAVAGLVPPAFSQDADSVTFLEDPNAYYVAQIQHLGTYELALVYEVYFRGSGTIADILTGVDENKNPLFEEREVQELSDLVADRASLLACVGDVCRPLGPEQSLKGNVGTGPGNRVRLTVSANDRPLRKGEDLRLIAEPGWINRSESGPSQGISVTLPGLGAEESSALKSHPFLRLFLSPISEEDETDEDASTLKFEGGLNKFRRASRMGLQYDGTISTDDGVGFNAIEILGDYERNLLAGKADYLPLKFELGVETDQSADLVNGVFGASLSYLLPWNANFSPRGEGYIPSTGPLVEFKAEIGTQLEQDTANPAAAAAPADFERAGYDFRWRLPVARDTLLRIHHAGVWVSGDSDDDFHQLWDVALETKIGNLSYFIGFQQGEAAPLFQTTETTQVGVVLRLGQRLRCSTVPGSGSGSKITCAQPQ